VARGAAQLSPAEFRRLAKVEGLHSDGGNLLLQVSRNKHGGLRRSWIFRYATNGRARDMGIGSLDTLTLSEAREVARRLRQLRLEGVDPLEDRRAKRAAAAVEVAKMRSFDQCRDQYLREHRAKWRNAQHAREWLVSLQRYITPEFGSTPVKDIDLSMVIRALEKFWNEKPETASRVRGRIETVLDWAAVSGLRSSDNPARWSLLSKRFPARSKIDPVVHYAAMPFDQVPDFMKKLRAKEDGSARALELIILTAARAGEGLRAQWDEFDLTGAIWTIPATRMKSGKQHQIPLATPVVTLLKRLHEDREGDLLFPGRNRGALSDAALRSLLERMQDSQHLTTHGFRSSFRDWVAERTAFDSDLAEAALSHAIGNKVRRSYQRGNLFERRRQLMDAWAAFCDGGVVAGDVIPIRQSA
jgi:integrase